MDKLQLLDKLLNKTTQTNNKEITCTHNYVKTDSGYYSCINCGLVNLDIRDEYDYLQFDIFYQYNDRYFTTHLKYSSKYKHLYEIQIKKNSCVRSLWYYYNILRVKVKCECGSEIFKGSLRHHLHSKKHLNFLFGKLPENISKKENNYYNDNKENISEKKNKYYNGNKEIIKKKNLKYYYETRRGKTLKKVVCKCGREVSKGNLKAHYKSKIHIKRMENKKLDKK